MKTIPEWERIPTARLQDEGSVAALCDELDRRLHLLWRLSAQTMWAKYTGDGQPGDLNAIDAARARLLRDPDCRAAIERWIARVSDPLLRRRLELLRRACLGAEVQLQADVFELKNRIADRIIGWRPELDGERIDVASLRQVLRRDPDRERRGRAWRAFAELSRAVRAETVELLQRRNAHARELGFPGYPDLSLHLDGLERVEVLELIEELRRLTQSRWDELLAAGRQRLSLDDVQPWDVGFLVEQGASLPEAPFPAARIVDRLDQFVAWFGVDPRRLNISIRYVDIPYGGLCMSIDPPHDVRILANPRDGHAAYATMFHEYGHALHAVHVDQESFLLRREPGPFNEGMAQVWSHFCFYPDWLRSVGVDAAGLERFAVGRQFGWLYRLRQLAASVAWEYAAYDQPGSDQDAALAAAESRFLGVAADPSPRWAASPFPTSYPIYWQNYIVADVIAAQTHAALRRRFAPVAGVPAAFEHLRKHYWAPGAAIPWQEKVERATGCRLSAADLAAELRGDAHE